MSEKVKRYRHGWTRPDGTTDHEFGGDGWHRTRKGAIKGREALIKRAETSDDDEYTDYFQPAWNWEVEEREFPVYREQGEHIMLLLDEEYGYRTWLWHTGKTADELVAFWEGLESVMPYFLDPRKLPGTLAPAWFGEDAEDGLWSIDPTTLGWEECDNEACCRSEHVAGTQVFVPHPKQQGWTGHIHQDDDSGIGGDGITVRHKGYEPPQKDPDEPAPLDN
jgi:hypothetical protein